MTKEYVYYIDKKVTIWEREIVTFKARNEEDANKIAMVIFENGRENIDEVEGEYETLFETAENISLEDNKGYSTIEIGRDNGKILFKNGK